MKNLMKYEFRKTAAFKVLLVGAAAVAQVAFLIGLYGNFNRVLGVSVFLLTMIAICGIMAIGLFSVVQLHRDMNTKQSYMLFMTPNSCYKILGAKVLENGLSILMAGAFFFALGALDLTLLFSHEGQLEELWNAIRQFLSQIDKRITLDFATMLTFVLSLLASWISTVTCAYLGVVISTAILNGKRGNGFISFLIIVALLWLTSFIELRATEAIVNVRTVFLVQSGIALVLSVVMYVLTARIMDTKLSV
ncbi:MAG: hypothetical protein IJ174_08460 [Clostridia bacterium]|nr:hypothetical protein [Clostridia bacterium]